MTDPLDAFVGEWRVQANFPPDSPIGDIAAHAIFERMLDDRVRPSNVIAYSPVGRRSSR